jgi:phosphate transport system substrate-binding protein
MADMIENSRRTSLTAVLVVLAACGGGDGAQVGGEALSGRIEIDGSSTVYPISEAVAEEFTIATGSAVNTTVAFTGTGGGFKRFCAGETDISDASRPIKESEAELCAQSGVEYLELRVALDGLAVLVHPSNDFAQCITLPELKRVWEPGSTVKIWSDVRPEWPAEAIRLYGPGTNSGTFDYFTEAVMGTEDASRPDYTASEDDNVLVQGVEGDRFALGYFGYAYFEENQERLKALQVDGGAGCVAPTPETITSGTYTPLSRPLMIYVRKASLSRPEVRRFVEFYLEKAAELVSQVGYVPLEAGHYLAERARLDAEAGGR